jgi:hypothetical protein
VAHTVILEAIPGNVVYKVKEAIRDYDSANKSRVISLAINKFMKATAKVPY